MTQQGIDYSVSRPNPAEVHAAGKTFVVRYLAFTPNPKVITKTELAALHNAGLGVAFVWEQASGDMLKGHAEGVTHATEAKRQLAALGVPSTVPCYFACDVNVNNTTQMRAAASYLDGVDTVLTRTRVGVYGEADVIDYMLPNHAAYGWQTYAWSGGRVSGKAHLYQYRNGVSVAGADCDLDRSLKDNFGGWFPTTPVKKGHTMLSLDGLTIPLLQEGDDDAHFDGYHNVRRVQAILVTIFNKSITVDGVYGPATTKAVKEVLDGITGATGTTVGLKEWAVLYGMTPSV